jgi:DNA-binding response OmpR family regulator
MKQDSKGIVMLIDDSSTNNLLYESILETEGFGVIVCDSVKMALKKLSQLHPDLIILDLMMPGLDGFDFMDKRKELTGTENIPVIMLTARIDQNSERKAYDMGVADYINKPVGIHEIVDRIDRVLSSRIR